MSKLLKTIGSKIDRLPALGIYSLLLIVNAFSQSTYIQIAKSNTTDKG
jgi:monomeric isocitrate dehydrogenase